MKIKLKYKNKKHSRKIINQELTNKSKVKRVILNNKKFKKRMTNTK